MINIIRSDIYRMFRSIPFYCVILLSLFWIGANVYMVQAGSLGVAVVTTSDDEDDDSYLKGNKMDTMSVDEISRLSISEYRDIMLTSTNYKLDKDALSLNMNLFFFFIFAVVIFITSDFSNGSIKNTLSSAISRSKYFGAKVTMAIVVNILVMLLHNLGTNILGRAINGNNVTSSFSYVLKTTLLQLPVVIAMCAFLCGMGFLLRRTAIFNTCMIPLTLVIPLLITIISKLASISPIKINKFEWATMFYKLANSPSDSYIATAYIVCAVVTIGSLALGWFSFSKREIK